MSIWMYVIRMLETAVVHCYSGCYTADDCPSTGNAANALDQAVAFYTGSLQGSDGSGDGVLLYELAKQRAVNFRTAGPSGNSVEGDALVNIEIFQQFQSMQQSLAQGNCKAAQSSKNIVAQKMTIPLVQGALESCYLTDSDPSAPVQFAAQGTAYGAAILPIVANCNQEDAITIYQNMHTNQGNTCDFNVVKPAFEKNYACMGITASDVGGLWNAEKNDYYPGAEPVYEMQASVTSTRQRQVKNGLVAGLSVGGVVLLLFLLRYLWCRRKVRRTIEEETEIVFRDNDNATVFKDHDVGVRELDRDNDESDHLYEVEIS